MIVPFSQPIRSETKTKHDWHVLFRTSSELHIFSVLIGSLEFVCILFNWPVLVLVLQNPIDNLSSPSSLGEHTMICDIFAAKISS